MGLFVYLLVGLLVGTIARSLVKGQHRLGCLGTSVLGILGSVVGGVTLSILGGDGFKLSGAGFLGSIFGSVMILVVIKKLSENKNR